MIMVGTNHPCLKVGHHRYIMTMIDDASKYFYVYLLKTKDEALNCFKIYKTKLNIN
jgi:hypothetical protein